MSTETITETVAAETTDQAEQQEQEQDTSPATLIARIDAALAELDERRTALTRRTSAVPGVIQEELVAIAAEESRAREPIGQLEAELSTYPGRVGTARAAVTIAQGSAAVADAEATLEGLLEEQRQVEQKLTDARAACDETLARCLGKRARLHKEKADLDAGLAEISSARAALEQQKTQAYSTAGMQIVARIRDEVEQLRGQVTEQQAALDAASAQLRSRQERIPAELGAYVRVPQVAATMSSLLTDDAEKSGVQVLLDALASFLATLQRLRGGDLTRVPISREVTDVLGALGNGTMLQHVLRGDDGANMLVRMQAAVLAGQERERRRLAGLE